MAEDKNAQFVVHLDFDFSNEQKLEMEKEIQSAVLQKVVELGLGKEISTRSFPKDSPQTSALKIGWPPILGLWLE